VKVTEGGVGTTPVPERVRVVGELAALLTNEMLPETVPAEAGAKATVKLVLWPAERVKGRERPVAEKPLPEAGSGETVKLAVPELVSLIVCVFFEATPTSPKLTLDGDTAS
jgi:hypothetical protein